MKWRDDFLNSLYPPAPPQRGILSPPEPTGTGLLSFPGQQQRPMGLFGPLPPQPNPWLRVSQLMRDARDLNAGNYGAAEQEFSKWIYSNGIRNPGLVNRRALERDLFTNGIYGTQ